MAPFKIQWDPEVLEDGFHPSSIFDEVATTTTAPVDVDVVGVQSTAAAANPAHNVTTVLESLVEEMVRQVADLATNPTTTPIPSTTTTTSTTTPSRYTTATTIIRRAVDTAAQKPEIVAESVSIFFIFIVNCQNVFFVNRPKIHEELKHFYVPI